MLESALNSRSFDFSEVSVSLPREINQNPKQTFLRRTNMQNVTRRSFVSGVAAGVTALGALSGISNEADAQLVWKSSDWKLAEFEKLVKDPARIKQVYDVVQIADGK